jgi:pyruvate dehydrogenase E2 component (dihydrolipoamide acetyltransferase)
MARRLTAVKQEVPHFYLALDVEVSRLLALRTELNLLAAPVKLTLNHFIVAAIGRALKDLPQANRIWADGEIVTYASTDVGVAVSTERGLLVPVVRDAGRVSLLEAARRTQAQVERARAGTLTADDMSGGAITVSNAGMHNVRFMTPIINPGQAMILGVGSVDQVFRPDAEGKPALRQEMGLVLAGDHRILDGVAGLAFLNRVAAYLEQPMKLLLDE